MIFLLWQKHWIHCRVNFKYIAELQRKRHIEISMYLFRLFTLAIRACPYQMTFSQAYVINIPVAFNFYCEYSCAAEPPVRCSLSQSTDGTDPLLFCLVNDSQM